MAYRTQDYSRDIDIGTPTEPETARDVMEDLIGLIAGANLEQMGESAEEHSHSLRKIAKGIDFVVGQEVSEEVD